MTTRTLRKNWLRAVWLIGLTLSSPVAGHSASYTNIQTVFLIVMENVTWPDLAGSTNGFVLVGGASTDPDVLRGELNHGVEFRTCFWVTNDVEEWNQAKAGMGSASGRLRK